MPRYRPVAERLADFRPVELRLPPEAFASARDRCMDCGIPFCHAVGCSLMNAIPEINAQALAGRWSSALATLLDASPFPEFTARVCPAPCEGSCVRALHGDPVPCRAIEMEVVERGFARGSVRPRPPAARVGANVAVVGSGPAGLAAAWRLNRAGATVTVFERDARPGGFLRYGIPDFKLEKEVLDRRVDLLEREGIAFECGVSAGDDLSGGYLARRFDALLLACGARRPRDLDIAGRPLSGIHFAFDYLAAQNRAVGGERDGVPAALSAKGRRVVVIGGGDTGSDCIGTAWRQGAAEVEQLEILPEPPPSRAADNPWPEWPRVRRDSSSHEEGGRRRWNVATLAFLPSAGAPGRVGALRCAEVRWNGGKPVVLAGTEWERPADLVLLATGFAGVEPSPLFGGVGAAVGPRGVLLREAGGRCAPGVYAAGDGATGPSLVVRAVADGLAVADAMLEDLHAQA